jgi:hypothetical protein
MMRKAKLTPRANAATEAVKVYREVRTALALQGEDGNAGIFIAQIAAEREYNRIMDRTKVIGGELL